MKRANIRVYTDARLSGVRDDDVAGNKKKRQYHRPPAQKVNVPRPVRLSQCMIVKNEEHNIARALSWAKGYAFEQIVVDTGSTDRTVEIAESMGAKVYHFKWINDFSAAKNFAIEQATGNWIAFLDADEWIPDDDVPKLMKALNTCESDATLKHFSIICFPLVNLNDEGLPFHTMEQNRVFRNRPDIRYLGSIHEILNAESRTVLNFRDIQILHTGYQQSVYNETDKLDRNIELIKKVLEDMPDAVDMKVYLADSYDAKADEASKQEALRIYTEVVDSGQWLPGMLARKAYDKVIIEVIDSGDLVLAEKYVRSAVTQYPDYIDFHLFLGEVLFNTERYAEAWECLRTAESLFDKFGLTQPNLVVVMPTRLFNALCHSAVKIEDAQNAVKYATLSLREDKMQQTMLGPLLMTLKSFGDATEQDILRFLEQLYDFENMRDKVFLARVANSVDLLTLRDMIMALITPEEVAYMSASE